MIRSFFVVLIAFYSLSAAAQPLELQWAKSIGGAANDYTLDQAMDQSGNIYMTGSFYGVCDFDPGPGVFTLDGGPQSDPFVAKLDPDGNFLWAVSLEGEIGSFRQSIAIDPSGNVVIAGEFNGTTDFNPGEAVFNLSADDEMDSFILKLDPEGNFLWANKIGGTDHQLIQAVTIDQDGTIYVAGQFKNEIVFPQSSMNKYANGGFDIFYVKITSEGNFFWAIAVKDANARMRVSDNFIDG